MSAWMRITIPIFSREFLFRALFGLLLMTVMPAGLLAQPEKIKTATHVKVRAEATKPADGRQTVRIELEIDPDYYLIGNQVPELLAPSGFRVSFLVKEMPVAADIVYPPGTLKKNDIIGDYTKYRGKVVTTATVQRAAGDTGPLEVVLWMQGYPLRQTY
jgi:hypothetical protein